MKKTHQETIVKKRLPRKLFMRIQIILTTLLALSCNMHAHYKHTKIIDDLNSGNTEFQNNYQTKRDHEHRQAKAIVFACMDNPISPSNLFKQDDGDLWVIRQAGPVYNQHLAKSLSIAVNSMNIPTIVVLGNTPCDILTHACNQPIDQIESNLVKPIQDAKTKHPTLSCEDPELIDQISTHNIHYQVQKILEDNPDLKQLVNNKQVEIVGALFDVRTGKVTWLSGSH